MAKSIFNSSSGCQHSVQPKQFQFTYNLLSSASTINICFPVKADVHFTIPQRIEGCFELGS